MNGFLDIDLIDVPLAVVEEVHEFLRFMGGRGSEGFALWAGVKEGTVFSVQEAIVPDQRGLVMEGGICVTVGPDELHRLNVDLFQRGLRVIAQIHSHPGPAYHSDTDDVFPIATTVGCLSLVVPDFARYSFSPDTCATYRLSEEGFWKALSKTAVRSLIHII